MLLVVEKGIREGIYMISKRYSMFRDEYIYASNKIGNAVTAGEQSRKYKYGERKL